MSATDQSQEIIEVVLELTVEPMYLSEIARKIQLSGVIEDVGLKRVTQAASVLTNRDGVEIYSVGYDDNDGQYDSSPKLSLSEEGGVEETDKWNEYTVIHNNTTDYDSVREGLKDYVDPSVTLGQKEAIINILAGEGNRMSKVAEAIMQDEMERQFRNYDIVEVSGYNDPGPDFYVEDDDMRDYGLLIEVTVRHENPVDKPYIDSKQEDAIDRDADVVILGPSFTDTMATKYEDIEGKEHEQIPDDSIVHLHRVPNDKPEVYRPFGTDLPPEYERDTGGFPIILPDTDSVRGKLIRTGHVGDSYPVVDSMPDRLVESLEDVSREFDGIRESGYRTQLREAIEPLLYEFGRPYQIEQYLIDTYWDKGLTQAEIGRLNGVSDRTISEWMSDNRWDIITRGTNTPLDDSIVEIWRRMYEGEEPFDKQHTGYEIQSLYNQFPYYSLSDWEEWNNLSEEQKARLLEIRVSARDNVEYTILLGSENRLFPSYDFIIERLRRAGVDIRAGTFSETGTVYPTGTALEYMINRDFTTLGRDGDADSRDIVAMRSGLEVEFGEWLSDNEIPYAYEPFLVPSRYTPSGNPNQMLEERIKGDRRDDAFEIWQRLYDKHALGEEGDVGVEEGFELFDRQEIEPDFALYPNAEKGPKPRDWDGWTEYSHLIEVAGAYGIGILTDWRDWYRVNSVAYKELAFKILGIWQRVYFIITDDQSITDEVRNDPHYIIVNPTQLDAGYDKVGVELGL